MLGAAEEAVIFLCSLSVLLSLETHAYLEQPQSRISSCWNFNNVPARNYHNDFGGDRKQKTKSENKRKKRRRAIQMRIESLIRAKRLINEVFGLLLPRFTPQEFSQKRNFV